jgi:hypothetical protein
VHQHRFVGCVADNEIFIIPKHVSFTTSAIDFCPGNGIVGYTKRSSPTHAGLPTMRHYLSFDFNFVKCFGILKRRGEITGPGTVSNINALIGNRSVGFAFESPERICLQCGRIL